jgi:hypothetical protein
MEEQVHRSNLSSALYLAIKTLEAQEKAAGYTGPSGMLAGFQDLKKKVDSGECDSIYIKD